MSNPASCLGEILEIRVSFYRWKPVNRPYGGNVQGVAVMVDDADDDGRRVESLLDQSCLLVGYNMSCRNLFHCCLFILILIGMM